MGKRMIMLAVLAACALSAAAEERLSVRLVEASNDGEGISRELQDVAPLLKSNLPYRRFSLQDQKTIALPTAAAVPLARGCLLRCNGVAERLSVTLEKNGKVMVQTQLNLKGGRPFVLGGFPDGQGKLLLILVVK